MSTATRLGDRGGQRHVGKQAEAGGACSSEHGSCWPVSAKASLFSAAEWMEARSPPRDRQSSRAACHDFGLEWNEKRG